MNGLHLLSKSSVQAIAWAILGIVALGYVRFTQIQALDELHRWTAYSQCAEDRRLRYLRAEEKRAYYNSTHLDFDTRAALKSDFEERVRSLQQVEAERC